MWEINSRGQILTFLYSLLTGGIFCLSYDVFRAARKAVKHSVAAIFIEDIFCFTVWAYAFFCFLLATVNGEIRFFAIIGVILGFAVTRLTVSRFSFKFFVLAAKFIYGIFTAICGAFEYFFDLLNRIFGKTRSVLRKKLKKAVKVCKKLLKMQ